LEHTDNSFGASCQSGSRGIRSQDSRKGEGREYKDAGKIPLRRDSVSWQRKGLSLDLKLKREVGKERRDILCVKAARSHSESTPRKRTQRGGQRFRWFGRGPSDGEIRIQKLEKNCGGKIATGEKKTRGKGYRTKNWGKAAKNRWGAKGGAGHSLTLSIFGAEL